MIEILKTLEHASDVVAASIKTCLEQIGSGGESGEVKRLLALACTAEQESGRWIRRAREYLVRK